MRVREASSGRTALFGLLVTGLFAVRIGYGLCSEFWFDDELQTYLLGLKSFTTRTWPWLGPDVVYTHTQIPGALEGLLVGGPFFLAPVPEAPAVFLGLLSFATLSLLAWYLCRRFPRVPAWLVWSWVMIAPWTINYGTRVVNPSYVMVFSVPFFVAFSERFIHRNELVGRRASMLVMGVATTCLVQLHMSWVLLVPFASLCLASALRDGLRSALEDAALYAGGLCLGASTLVPTLLQDAVRTPSTLANVTFNPGNLGYPLLVLVRFLSFASFDVVSWLGHEELARREVLAELPWMAPVSAFLLAVACLQGALFIAGFFRRGGGPEWRRMAWVTLGAVAMTWMAFFFSIKGPDSHTFCILLPLALLYSFHCYDWLLARRRAWIALFAAAVVAGFLFTGGVALHGFRHHSLYRDRPRVVRAIELRDYTQLGLRRADLLGYGY